MKTTIDIADSLLLKAKRLAAENHLTLKTLIESALRDVLAAKNKPRKSFRLEPHVFKGQGLQAGLSWDDWDTLRSLTYEGRGG